MPLARRPLVDRVEQPAELEVGELALVAQRPGELRAAVADAGEPADELHADARERVEVERRPFGRARRVASTARGGRARCRPPRRSARRARRPPPSTSGCRGRGTSRGPRTCSPTASVTGRPERWISWAICTPVADAPTTSTPPSASCVGVAVLHRRERRRPTTAAPSAKAGTVGTLNAPVASTTVAHCHSPWSVRDAVARRRCAAPRSPSCRCAPGPRSPSRTPAMKSTTSGIVMKPSGSSPS